MGRQCFLSLATTDDSTANVISAQQKSLDSLTKVILDNIMALDYILDEHKGVCAMTNTTCCTEMNTSRETESQLCNSTEQA